MTTDRNAAQDAAALLSSLSGLPGVDHDALRQARQAMADAMGVDADYQALLVQQWAVMQAAADAVRGDGNILDGAEGPLATSRQLAQARACFDVAVEAIRALNEAATTASEEPMDKVVRHFQAELSRIRGKDNKQ